MREVVGRVRSGGSVTGFWGVATPNTKIHNTHNALLLVKTFQNTLHCKDYKYSFAV